MKSNIVAQMVVYPLILFGLIGCAQNRPSIRTNLYSGNNKFVINKVIVLPFCAINAAQKSDYGLYELFADALVQDGRYSVSKKDNFVLPEIDKLTLALSKDTLTTISRLSDADAVIVGEFWHGYQQQQTERSFENTQHQKQDKQHSTVRGKITRSCVHNTGVSPQYKK